MFQPTNPSFVQTLAQVSLDTHMNETEEELAARQGQTYREIDLPGCAPHLLETLRRWLSVAVSRSDRPTRDVAMRHGRAATE